MLAFWTTTFGSCIILAAINHQFRYITLTYQLDKLTSYTESASWLKFRAGRIYLQTFLDYSLVTWAHPLLGGGTTIKPISPEMKFFDEFVTRHKEIRDFISKSTFTWQLLTCCRYDSYRMSHRSTPEKELEVKL